MPAETYTVEEVEVAEQDNFDDWDDDDEDEMDDDTKVALAFGAGLAIAYFFLTRPRASTRDEEYASALERASQQ